MLCRTIIILAVLLNSSPFNSGISVKDGNGRLETLKDRLNAQDGIQNQTVATRGMVIERYKSIVPNGNNNTEKDNKVIRNNKTEGGCHMKKEMCLILALSKIAKVQVADENRGPRDRGIKSRIFEDVKNSGSLRNAGGRKESDELSSNRFKEHEEITGIMNSSGKQMRGQNIHCHAIRDVYIPDVKQKLPAFACKFQDKIFVLSSARFLEDRRSYLDINIDESTSQNIKSSPKVARSNAFNIVPALLVLKTGDDNYKLRSYANHLNRGKADNANGSS